MATSSHLTTEKIRIGLIALFGIAIGWVAGSVWMGLAITFFLYSCWLIYQANKVDVWLQRGAQRNYAPDTDGVIGNIEKLIFRRKQSDKNRKARLKKILGWYNRSAAALPDATVITNNNFEIMWANEAAQSYLGIRGSRDAGQRIDNLVRNLDFQRYVKDNDPQDLEIEFKSPINNKFTLALTRVAYAENMYLFSARDVSQRVQLRETRAAFVANASHELKTPLTVVNGYLELLTEDHSLPEQTKEKIQLAQKHAMRMSDIVTDLLSLSRLENQTLERTKLTQVDISTILTALSNELSNSDVGNQYPVNTYLTPGMLLHGSESEIKSLCSNLYCNAMQHNPPGTEITLEWQPTPEGGALLAVHDRGQGIPAKDRPHIMERFYRVDSEQSRESGGTGLGLSIVKHIVNRHQGQLQVHSDPGLGTRFEIRFPAEKILNSDNSTDPLAQSA